MQPPDLRRSAEQLQALYCRARDLDPRTLPRGDEAALAQQAAALGAVVDEAIAVAAAVQAATDQGEVDDCAWGDHFEDTLIGDTPVVAAAAVQLGDELWRNVADLAYTAGSELRRAARLLARAKPDERAAACGSARRKLRRALAALLGAIGRAQGIGYPLAADETAELDAALAVRALYTKFRRALPACDPHDPNQVRRALRLAAVGVAVLVGHADFGEVREEDRRLILRLQNRILSWARDGAAEDVGARLHQDLTAVADLLRAINLRQELVTHDRAALAELHAIVRAGTPASARLAAALPILRSLHGLDDLLDDALAAAQREPDATAALAAVEVALRARTGDAA